MKTTSVSTQAFNGRVIGCSCFRPKQRNIFKQVRPCLENMVKNKNYDLKIYTSFGTLRIGIWKHSEYIEPESNTCGAWISCAKEVISSYEKDNIY